MLAEAAEQGTELSEVVRITVTLSHRKYLFHWFKVNPPKKRQLIVYSHLLKCYVDGFEGEMIF